MLSTSARPLSTTLGGTCCRPSALRNRLSTTTSLVKEVTITATKGAIASSTTVSSADEGENWVRSIVPSLGELSDEGGVGLGGVERLDRERPAAAQGHQPARGQPRGARAGAAPQRGRGADLVERLARAPAAEAVDRQRLRQAEPHFAGDAHVGLFHLWRRRQGGCEARQRRRTQVDRHAEAALRRLRGRAQE